VIGRKEDGDEDEEGAKAREQEVSSEYFQNNLLLSRQGMSAQCG
jgi:hypothetical protein